ncbi:hypothetical protein KKD40_01915 [Candidatus Micrarchaeota archaeon]|nr:hypothetical protein [Candidatus Micrarchaeota archaeon]
MNIIDYLNKINAIGKYLVIAVIAMNLFSVSFASSNICSALQTLCKTSQVFLGAAIMVMILMAGATYAIGQLLGAETRARASVWATAMMTGALIGALIYLITPAIIAVLLPADTGVSTVVVGSTDPCSFTCA